MEAWIDALIKDMQLFLITDSRFSWQPYVVRFEIGDDKATAGVNIYTIQYDFDVGQNRESIDFLINYFEIQEQVKGSRKLPYPIKERMKVFYNKFNPQYSVGLGKNIADACKRFYVENMKVVTPLVFAPTDKNFIIGEFVLRITRRNDFQIEEY